MQRAETELLRTILANGNCPAKVIERSYCHQPDPNNPKVIFHIHNDHKSLIQDHDYVDFQADLYMGRKVLKWYADQAFYINQQKDNLLNAVRQIEDIFFSKTADKGSRHLIFKDVKLHQIDPEGSMENGNILNGYARMPDKRNKGESYYEKELFSRNIPATGNYVFNLTFYGLSGAMIEQEIMGMFSGNAGHKDVKHHNLDVVLKSQRILEKNFEKWGARYEKTGFDLLRESGHETEIILKNLFKESCNLRTHDGYTDTLEIARKTVVKSGPQGITAKLTLGQNVKWVNDKIVIKQSFPDSVVSALPGKTVSCLFEHPVLGDKIITEAKYKNGTLSIRIPLEWESVDWSDERWKNEDFEICRLSR